MTSVLFVPSCDTGTTTIEKYVMYLKTISHDLNIALQVTIFQI